MSDNRMLVATVVGTGIAMTTIIVAFVGIIAGGINNRFDDVNSRIDDVNATINNRISDMNNRFDDLNDSVNNRFDAVNRQLDDLQQEMRELRALMIDTIKGADPTADNE